MIDLLSSGFSKKIFEDFFYGLSIPFFLMDFYLPSMKFLYYGFDDMPYDCSPLLDFYLAGTMQLPLYYYHAAPMAIHLR